MTEFGSGIDIYGIRNDILICLTEYTQSALYE